MKKCTSAFYDTLTYNEPSISKHSSDRIKILEP